MKFIVTAVLKNNTAFPVGVFSSKYRASKAVKELKEKFNDTSEFYMYRFEEDKSDLQSPPVNPMF